MVAPGGTFRIQQQLSDRRDFALLGATPALMQPRFGSLAALAGGHRYIVAQSGLYVEARTPVLHACACIAPVAEPLPYGPVETFVRLPSPEDIRPHLARAVEAAKHVSPMEWAGYITYADGSGYDLVSLPVVSRSTGHISYDRSSVDEDAVVIDIHSHGEHGAYFSEKDDEDDRIRGGIYLAVVIGHCTATPEIAARLVVNGHLLPVYFNVADYVCSTTRFGAT
jgi:PRTRC genetic system protein A